MSRNYSSTAVDTTLTTGVSAAATTIPVGATTGFPAAPFILALSAGSATQELVLVTAVGGLSLTVTRGYDSTVATTHDTGAVVSHSHAAIDFREAGVHIDAVAAHGATGEVVGTTNVQTLTNKTLTAPDATGDLSGFGEAWTAWNPAITASSGTFTTVSAAGRYTQVGKTVVWSLTIIITTAGSAANAILFPLPVTAQAGEGHIGTGRGNAALNVPCEVLNISTTQGRVQKYDSTTVIASARTLLLAGSYEAV